MSQSNSHFAIFDRFDFVLFHHGGLFERPVIESTLFPNSTSNHSRVGFNAARRQDVTNNTFICCAYFWREDYVFWLVLRWNGCQTWWHWCAAILTAQSSLPSSSAAAAWASPGTSRNMCLRASRDSAWKRLKLCTTRYCNQFLPISW